jgi:hypothetical protein
VSKLSKQVENRVIVSGKVVAAVRTHRAGIAVVLAAQAEAAKAPGSQAPTAKDFEKVMEAWAATLEKGADDMREAELAYTAEQADDVAPRGERDALAAEGISLMTKLRSSVEDVLGAAGLATYGLSGATPRAPRAVESHMTNVISLLVQKPAVVTTDLGGKFDTAAVVAAITPKRDALKGVLGTLDNEARELEEAMGKRDAAVEAWIDVYQGVATAFSGVCRLAGRKDLADRVRPTTRTVSGEDAGELEEGGEPGPQ